MGVDMGIARRVRRLARIASVGLFIAAVAEEMSKPESERTWNGRVFGVVPYDFRPPTWDRLREAYWNPEDDRLFTARPFGVGWAINFFQVRRMMVDAYSALMGEARPAVERWRERTGGTG
jgi:hypothetical protein